MLWAAGGAGSARMRTLRVGAWIPPHRPQHDSLYRNAFRVVPTMSPAHPAVDDDARDGPNARGLQRPRVCQARPAFSNAVAQVSTMSRVTT